MQDYQATLQYLYTQLPMYQRVGKAAFKKDLTNIHALLEALGNPEQKFAAIHVGGTNGKGSVSHLLGAALQAGGLKVGMYTSPHYKDFRERIKINGRYISKKAVVRFVTDNRILFETIKPSFFEITVAMAFHHFAQQKVDLAVVEVGLGGRLDSTNVLQPELSVITNISYDHQQFLGDTLSLIAGEKAGIIKTDIPIVIGETQLETAPVFRAKAEEMNAPLSFADQHFQVDLIVENKTHSTYGVYRNQQLYTPELRVALHGPFQTKNIQTALQALEVWQLQHAHRHLPFKAIEKGWGQLASTTRYQGRWQLLNEDPLVIADSAHNIGGLELVLKRLEKISENRQLHIVLGMVNDKELASILPLFPSTAHYYFAKADIPRGLAATVLQATAVDYDLHGRTYVSVRNAYRAARRAANHGDVIFIGGSIFTVAEVL